MHGEELWFISTDCAYNFGVTLNLAMECKEFGSNFKLQRQAQNDQKSSESKHQTQNEKANWETKQANYKSKQQTQSERAIAFGPSASGWLLQHRFF